MFTEPSKDHATGLAGETSTPESREMLGMWRGFYCPVQAP